MAGASEIKGRGAGGWCARTSTAAAATGSSLLPASGSPCAALHANRCRPRCADGVLLGVHGRAAWQQSARGEARRCAAAAWPEQRAAVTAHGCGMINSICCLAAVSLRERRYDYAGSAYTTHSFRGALAVLVMSVS